MHSSSPDKMTIKAVTGLLTENTRLFLTVVGSNERKDSGPKDVNLNSSPASQLLSVEMDRISTHLRPRQLGKLLYDLTMKINDSRL